MTTDKQTQKETYEAPSMEVIKMENEGVIAASKVTTPFKRNLTLTELLHATMVLHQAVIWKI